MRAARLIAGIAGLVQLLCGGAAAQDAGDEEIEEITVLGVRTGRLERDVSAFRDVLYTDDYLGEQQDLADLLSREAGVFVRRFGGAGDPSDVSIRGSTSSQVVVTVNGVRLNSSLTGQTNLTRLCVPLIQKVGITRGVGGAREGSGAIGGVVDLVTRSAGRGPAETRAAFSRGDFETWKGSLFRSDRAADLGVSLGYCGLDTEGDFDFARPEFRGPDGTAQFRPRQTERINNQSTQHSGTLGLDHPLGPGRLELQNLTSYAEGGAPGADCCDGKKAGQNPKASFKDWNNLAQLRWSGAPGELLGRPVELDAMLYHRYEERRFRDPIQLAGGRVDSRTRLSTPGLRSRASFGAEALGLELDFELSLDAAQDWLSSTAQSSRYRTALAGGAALDLRALDDRLVLTSAVRADWVNDFDAKWVPAFGLVVTPLPWLRVRANAGRAHRFPTLAELFLPDEGFRRGNPRLSPEDAWNFDAGGELLFTQVGPFERVRLSGSWFRREIDDTILFVRISSTTVAPINTGDATSDGFELALDVDLTRFLHVEARHTEIDSTRDATNKRLPGQPDRETSVRVRLGPADLWKLVGEYRHTGDILVSEGSRQRIKSRTVWNASASVNLTGLVPFDTPVASLWLFFAIDNISDEAVRDTLAFPQPGRQASAGFEARF